MYRRAFARGEVKDGLRAFSLVKKYFRHIVDGFCKGRGGGGGGRGFFRGTRNILDMYPRASAKGAKEGWRNFGGVMRLLRGWECGRAYGLLHGS